MNMKKNIGTADRVVRMVIGIILIGIVFIVPVFGIMKIVLLVIGLFSLFQAFAGWCLLYQFMGKNTCPVQGVEKAR
jgi:hypothetical protein